MSQFADRYDALCYRAEAIAMLLRQLERDIDDLGGDWEILIRGLDIHLLHEGSSTFRTGKSILQAID